MQTGILFNYFNLKINLKYLIIFLTILFFSQVVFSACTWNGITVQSDERFSDIRGLCFITTKYQCKLWPCETGTVCNGFLAADYGDKVGSWTCKKKGESGKWCLCSNTECNPSGNGTRCNWCIYTPVTQEENETLCDGIDNDCDGKIDEGAKRKYYLDADGDGFGSNTFANYCPSTEPNNYVDNNRDCDDSTTSINPTRTDICDGIDNDCDGKIDQDFNCAKNTENCNADCSFKRRETDCGGTIPQNAIPNYGTTNGKFTQVQLTPGILGWSPASKNYSHSTLVTECAWKCNTSYNYDSLTGICNQNVTVSTCIGTKPENSDWNDNGQNGTYSYSGTNPNKSANYSQTANDCVWNCKSNYHYTNGECISNTKTTSCSISSTTLPENAVWNDLGKNGIFIQTWNENSWTPITKNSYFSEIPAECAYSCKEKTRSCNIDASKYCGIGQQDCNLGYWGNCFPTEAVICTHNQYCENNHCQFCSNETKNCDSNLINGCETNINTDINNCGECANECDLGQICQLSECKSINPDTNLCENITCGENSFCNTQNGACECEAGYYNCDGYTNNGCEKNTSCNQVTNNVECTQDSNCGSGKICSNNICQNLQTNKCFMNSDCTPNEYCNAQEKVCTPIVCPNGSEIIDHECVCKGKVCNSVCYEETGICCGTVWNKNESTCTMDLEDLTIKIDALMNEEATELLDTAKESAQKGNIVEAKLFSKLAEIRADSLNVSNPEIDSKIADTKVAIEEKNYALAEELMDSTILLIEENKSSPDIFGTLILIVIIIIFIGAGYLVIQKFKKDNEEY